MDYYPASRDNFLPTFRNNLSVPQKTSYRTRIIGVRYPKAGRKPEVHVSITVFNKFLLSERREYKLKLWRMRIIHTSSHAPVSEFTPFIIREDLCEMKINKAIPLQAWRGPEGSRRLRLPDLKTIGT